LAGETSACKGLFDLLAMFANTFVSHDLKFIFIILLFRRNRRRGAVVKEVEKRFLKWDDVIVSAAAAARGVVKN